MDQKHTSRNWTVCMFFLIKLLKSRKNITERRNICQLSSYSIFVALLGKKVWDWDIFLQCKRKCLTKSEEFDLKSKLTTEFDLNLQWWRLSGASVHIWWTRIFLYHSLHFSIGNPLTKAIFAPMDSSIDIWERKELEIFDKR